MLEKRLLKNLDFVTIGTVLAIMFFGLVVIRSATLAFTANSPDPYLFVRKQIASIALGWVVAFLILTSDYSGWARYAKFFYWLNLALLAAVKVLGYSALGATRWIKLGPFQFQPSELAKILVIVTLATHLAKQEKVKEWRDFIPPLLHVALPLVLVLIQPDLGTSLVFIAILVGMLFMAGAPVPKLFALIGGGIAAAVGVVLAELKFGLNFPLKEFQLKRLIIFLNPESDRLGDGYHIIQSKIAVGSGGLLGKGLFFGTQNQLNFLPEQHTDFIFSVIGEELGFIGGITLILLFFFLLYRGIRAASQAREQYGTLLATGVVSMLAFHVLTNIGMTIGMMPVTGIPLPFVSYGGSSMLTNSVAIGILLNVYMRRRKILF